MPIKNYTTKIAAHTSTQQIQELLRKKGARRVMVEYDAGGKPESVAFECEISPGTSGNLLSPIRLPFRIKAQVGAMERCLRAVKDRRYQGRAQAERVAWRLVRDWVDVQMAFVEAGQAELAELFLGKALSTQRDSEGRHQTFYQVLLSGEGPRLLAEHF